MKRNLKYCLLPALACIPLACGQKNAGDVPLRSEYITVYDESRPNVLLSDVQLPFKGIKDGKLHVLTNADIDMRYTDDGSGWFSIKNIQEVEPGHRVITYDAVSLIDGNSLAQRTGYLSFTAPELYLGKFMKVRQGYDQAWEEDFSSFPAGCVSLSGSDEWSTPEIAVVATHYYDYVSFNAWAEASGDMAGRNLTLDVSVAGGAVFEDINRTTFRINVPLGKGPESSNLRWLLLSNGGGRMSSATSLKFSVHNPSGVSVCVGNLRVYKVSEAEIENFWDDDEEFNEDESEDDDWI